MSKAFLAPAACLFVLFQCCRQTAVGTVTWPCLRRRGPPSEGPAPVNRTTGVGAHASCLLLVITPARQMEGYEKQVPPRAQPPACHLVLMKGFNMVNVGCTYFSASSCRMFKKQTNKKIISKQKQNIWKHSRLIRILSNGDANIFGGGKAVLVHSGKVTCGSQWQLTPNSDFHLNLFRFSCCLETLE